MDPRNQTKSSGQGMPPFVEASSGRQGSGDGGKKGRAGSTQRNRAAMDSRGSPPESSRTPAPPISQQGTGPWACSGGTSGMNFSPQNPWGYQQGGFVNLLHQPYFPTPPQGGNFHFVRLINQPFNGTSPVPCSNGTASPEAPSGIDLDDAIDVEQSKAGKKRWTHDEQMTLAHAWLKHSKDSIHGTDKKAETFWKEITEEFNKKAPENRKRDTNQLKIQWSRLKTSINDFNGFWSTVTKLHTSGYSEDQLMDEAQKLYTSKNGKPFSLVHWWRILKNEPKWCAYVARLEKEKNKNVTIEVTDDDRDQLRPIGREAAKAQLKGKRKKEEIMDSIVILGDNLNKIVEMQKERKVEREKVSQTQLEISKTNLKAAKEQKETKLLEVYNSMLKQDTTNLTEAQIARREKMLEKMEAKLFADDLGED